MTLTFKNLFSNGEEWWKIRSELQKGLASPKNVRNFLPQADEIVKEFVEQLPRRFDARQEIRETLDEISRLNLELLCLMIFDKRVHCFSDEEHQPDSRTSKLLRAAEDSNNSILPTDQGLQLWRLFETAEYKMLRESQEYIERLAIEWVHEKVVNPTNGNSLLEQYLKNPKLDVKDLHGMAADSMLAGVDTTAYTLGFALYYISSDQRIQDLMFQEALKILPNESDEITPAIVNSEIPYTRAVMKETFRLNPISIGIGRITNKDMTLGGYHVPKHVRTFE